MQSGNVLILKSNFVCIMLIIIINRVKVLLRLRSFFILCECLHIPAQTVQLSFFPFKQTYFINVILFSLIMFIVKHQNTKVNSLYVKMNLMQ